MLKRTLMLVFACLIVASFSFAADTASTAATTGKTAMKSDSKSMDKLTGTIDKINVKTHTLSINTGSETKTVSFGSKTSYIENGKKVKIAQLKTGQKVDVWTDSKNMAHKIDIEPSMTH